MGRIRAPFLVLAVIFMIAAVLTEIGGTSFVNSTPIGDLLRRLPAPPTITADDLLSDSDFLGETTQTIRDPDAVREAYGEPPGYGVPYLALLDGVFAFTLLSMASGLIIPQKVQAQAQGYVTCLFSLMILFAAIGLIFLTIAAVLTMIVLLLAVPFGTIIYLIVYGSFDRSATSAVLVVVMAFKIAAIICIPLAHQGFLQRIGLVLLALSSLIGSIVVSFLHNLPPGILVSITDAIAGIIVALCGLIWSIPLLIAAIISMIKVLGLIFRARSVV